MNRLYTIIAALLVGANILADTVTVSVTANGAVAYSSPIVAGGWLDRIEIRRSDPETSAVVDVDIGTFAGTTALTTFADVNALATNGTKIVRTRVLGTGITGTDIAASALQADQGTGTNTVTGTAIAAPYERPMIGGNMLMKVTAAAGTNATVVATIFYEPLKK